MNLEEELLKIKAKISENSHLKNPYITETCSVIQENPQQQTIEKEANKNSTSKTRSTKNISTKSKGIQSRKLGKNVKKQIQISIDTENQSIIKSSTITQRRISTRQNQFQFVDTNASSVDKNCSTSTESLKLNEKLNENIKKEAEVKQETDEMIIKANPSLTELEDFSIVDVFADFKDSRIISDEDEGDDDISDDYLYLKNPEFMCEICFKIFETKSNYTRHINWVHQNEEQFYLCTRCPKLLNSMTELLSHIKEHKTRRHRRIVCEICGVEKTNTTHLEDHLRTHFEERSLICHICTASFKTKYALKTHLKRHAGVKNYKCEQCEAEFFDCSDYKRHLVKHGAIQKEFHCSICGNSFYERKLLRHHIVKVHNICNGEGKSKTNY